MHDLYLAMQRHIFTLLLLVMFVAAGSRASNRILGEPEILPEDMCEFVRQHNPNFSLEIAEAYFEIGSRYGIRGDVALCQAIIETGWFKFCDGTAVTPDQYNFCGLGVTRLGVKGHAFSSIQEGVTAQIQHLYAYATRSKLPDGEELVDARFSLVSRGCAPTWEGLGGRWAARKSYGKDILNLYDKMSSRYAGRNKSKSKADKRPKKAQDEVVSVVEPVIQPEIIILAEEEVLVASGPESTASAGNDSRAAVLGGLGMVASDAGIPVSSTQSSADVVRKAFENVSADEADASHCQPVFPAVPARLIPYFMEKATIHAPAD